MCISHASFGDLRNDVFAEVVAGVFIVIIFRQQLIKIIGIKDIDTHAGQRFAGIARHGGRYGRLFDKLNDLVALINRHHAESGCLFDGHRHTGHGAACPFFDVIDKHARVVLLIDMIAGEDHHVLRLVAANNIEVLGHRIRGTAVPVFTMHALLRRQQIDELVHLFAKERPAALDMLYQRVRLILGDNANAANT